MMDASQDVPPPGEPAESTAAWRRVLYADPAPPVDPVAPVESQALVEVVKWASVWVLRDIALFFPGWL